MDSATRSLRPARAATGHQPTLPDAHTVLDTYFDFAEKALAKQREVAQQAVAAGAKAASDQAAKMTAQA